MRGGHGARASADNARVPHRDRIRARLAAERASWTDHLGPREGRWGPRAGWVMFALGVTFTGLGAAAVTAVGATRIDPSAVGLPLLAWPALFLSLGWNFLEYGLDPPFGGIAWSWLLRAGLFALLGIPGLWLALGGARRIEDPLRARLVGTVLAAGLIGAGLGIALDGALG